ncbi:hypothetical protein [Lachnoclostridium phytofermentans]|uniref:Lipoprotein n=1 Tax=Lachnoclostridium phytofermentans (strain ATCC 700394 / DSM 18823 / ISDg) TaxID=357809 RepID=A9KRL8_LACP7|nr:hypothetical protein [Lachnoclostridium phytofermentans]ABX43512.1 hypothetical protein Cphy_3157 [Lachnoclostridium phytofermentans ISDg]
MKKKITCIVLLLSSLLITLSGCKGSSFTKLTNLPEVMTLLDKTRSEVNQVLGTESKKFKEHSSLGKLVMVANGKIRINNDLQTEYLNLLYKTEDEDAKLSSIDYVISYSNLDDAQRIWDWIYSQKVDLEKHYNRIADFNDGLKIEQRISEEELNNKESFWKECWTFDVDGSDKKTSSNFLLLYH